MLAFPSQLNLSVNGCASATPPCSASAQMHPQIDGYKKDHAEFVDILTAFGYITDVGFLMDIIITFRTCEVTPDGQMIKDPRGIAQRSVRPHMLCDPAVARLICASHRHPPSYPTGILVAGS